MLAVLSPLPPAPQHKPRTTGSPTTFSHHCCTVQLMLLQRIHKDGTTAATVTGCWWRASSGVLAPAGSQNEQHSLFSRGSALGLWEASCKVGSVKIRRPQNGGLSFSPTRRSKQSTPKSFSHPTSAGASYFGGCPFLLFCFFFKQIVAKSTAGHFSRGPTRSHPRNVRSWAPPSPRSSPRPRSSRPSSRSWRKVRVD